MATSKNPSAIPSSTRPDRLLHVRMIQNFHLVWLAGSIDEINNDDCRKSIMELRQIVNTVNTFVDADECMDFITDSTAEKALVIISGQFDPMVIPIVQDIAQVNSIFIFSESQALYENWVKKCLKVKGVYPDITALCEALKHATQDCNQNSVSISFVKTTNGPANQNLDTLDCSFMYTQILKEILLTIHFQQEHINDFLSHCREQLVGNPAQLNNVERLQREYHDHQPIWWYTSNSFLYSMLNRALRLMEVNLIIKMGFFVCDLHNHIVALHTEQYGEQHHSGSFTVFRGQGLSQTDFDQLKSTQGGLLAFNNFLSTSHHHDVSLRFARRTIATSDLMGVLFVMHIDPSISATPFASVKDVSCFRGEDEILFSMHAVFRIGEVKQIEKNDRLWQVDLQLTGDHDPQLHSLTESMRNETSSSYQGWHRLGQLMMKLDQFDQAEELYEILLEQSTNEGERGLIYHQLGSIKQGQGRYEKAVEFTEKSIAIQQKIPSPTHSDVAASYSNIGSVYDKMGEYSKALSYYDKALEIQQKTLPANHPSLATSYNNIGLVYKNTGEYSKALSYYEKALEIEQKTLPTNHPSLATSYSNIGSLYDNMDEYSKALSYHDKALEIQQKTLPTNHPSMATSYSNIGTVYGNMDEHSKALSYYDKALEILQKTLPANHPSLATSYSNIGSVYGNMGGYSNALSYHDKALEIQQKTLHENHPSLATSYSNIGLVYNNMGEYSKALLYYDKALEIEQKTFPTNHPSLATSYSNIGSVYANMGEYSKALSYYDKALEIEQKTLPANHPSLATSYSNIGSVYANMGQYSKALSYYDKALEIEQKTLPANHPSLATSYSNIGSVYGNMGEYSKALSYHDKALEIEQKTLPANHPSLATSYNNIGLVYNKMGEYSKALSYYDKALEIQQKTLHENHPSLATSYNNIGWVYRSMSDYSKALSYYHRALDIKQRSLPPNHASIANVKSSIEFVKKKL